MTASRFAFDRAPNRSIDRDGRLRVASSVISMAKVDRYAGHEIPRGDALGLDMNRLYRCWRHPDELARAAPTFDGLQVLARHIPVSAMDHKPNDTVGASGSNARFNAPYLTNSLTIWTADAIRQIENKTKCQLSCAYAYDAQVKSGVTPDGEPYDIIMRNIVGNHISLVELGRVGPLAVVGDGYLSSHQERYDIR